MTSLYQLCVHGERSLSIELPIITMVMFFDYHLFVFALTVLFQPLKAHFEIKYYHTNTWYGIPILGMVYMKWAI